MKSKTFGGRDFKYSGFVKSHTKLRDFELRTKKERKLLRIEYTGDGFHLWTRNKKNLRGKF